MKRDEHKILIAGSGLVGSLTALRLLQLGFDVELFESRSDMRRTDISAGRSINLALSHRGIRALELCGLGPEMMSNAIAMHGRMIHGLDGSLQFQEYSTRKGEHINSISRRSLNVVIMDAIEKIKPDCIHFNHRLVGIGKYSDEYFFENDQKEIISRKDSILIGADGAGSAARKWMLDQTPHFHFDYSQRYQNYGYKELTIPPGANGEFVIEKNALHIWPRGHFMMIALPNPDATYTATLFLPYHGNESFDRLQSNEQLLAFYHTYFQDALPLIPELNREFFEHPTGYLYTVKCFPWNYQDKILLIGDAAHAIIPFYGQGMNCGFEDVFILDQLIAQHTDWLELFSAFSKARKQNGDAIADLAEDNFIEMRDKVADPVFQRKRKLEILLEKSFPEYYSKYALVTFRPDISYYDAMIQGRKQDDLLMEICSKETQEWNEAELRAVYDRIVKG
ncbi:MAG: FAD-dependent monooxygenase [Saprospiraceae bacterium]|nr:FAD-dependent monooxygenase [Saprospiraceae bacterium]